MDLKQPKYGGEISYFADGKEIKQSEYETYSGTEITMNFNAWEGWICSYKDGEKFRVDDAGSQIINVNGTDINKLFTEDEGHKPE